MRTLEFPHLDRILDHFSGTADAHAVVVAGDGDNFKIQIWRQPSVQGDLLLAHFASAGKRRGVDEIETHGFLDLICVLSGQNDPRDQGLTLDEMRHRMGIHGRREHFVDHNPSDGVCGRKATTLAVDMIGS